MMGAVFRVAGNRWVRTLLGALLLSALIWLFGPLIGIGSLHPLDSETVRILVIAAIFVLWLVFNLVQVIRAHRRDQELAKGVAESAPDADAAASAEEIATLSERLKDAFAALRKARIGGKSRGYLYQLPWYMFIGPPGAGKTTALTHCGLNFPLADTHGPLAVRGVGGTRNCDWWFTDQAVLIDTAGRYTTQDSNRAVDSAAWLGFLRLLKRYRRRQPLNGVLLAIGLADLAALSEADRLVHAQTIRRRIRELHDELGVRIPAYVLFTKADLIAGFVEFFDNLGKEEREQVWGMTFPLDDAKDESGTVARFGPEFDALLARLNDRMLERVQQETDLQRRRLIYGFPEQLASLRAVAFEFLTEIFRPSRLEARPLLRGVYFTSGTQDGTPIDRLLGAMAGQFGLPRHALRAFSGTGRSYFLARLMREVLFGEAGLVSRDPKVERRQRLTQIAAYGTAAVVLLALIGAWTASYIGNRSMISAVHAAGIRYGEQYAALAKRGPQDADLVTLLPALGTLRDMPGGYEEREKETPLDLTFGLYQGRKLSAAANDGYGRALNDLLLPRLLARLEGLMQTHLDKLDFLYETLKVYLILGRQGPLDRDLVEQWIGTDIAGAYPGEENKEPREALLAHLHALLEYPLATVSLNMQAVQQARDILTREPLASYVYNRIMRGAVVQSLPQWTVADNAGPEAARVFVLKDGKPLNSGIPGIYTWSGFHQIFQPLLPGVSKDIAEDQWVLGRDKRGGLVAAVGEMNKMRQDVLGLYMNDYTLHWDAMLDNIALRPFASLAEGASELEVLSLPESPLRDLYHAIDDQTQLSRASAADQAAKEAEKKATTAGKRFASFGAYLARAGMSADEAQVATILAEAFGKDSTTGKPIETRVDEHFRDLHQFVVGGADKSSQLEDTISQLRLIKQNMNEAANSPNTGTALSKMLPGGGAGTGGPGATAQLQDLAQSVPKPVGTMLRAVSQNVTQVAANGASQQIADAWSTKVYPVCRDAFNRYPFVASSALDVPPDDFSRVLAPGGMMDQFFDQYLKAYVDKTQKPWRWQAGSQAKLNLQDSSLPQFQVRRRHRRGAVPVGRNESLVELRAGEGADRRGPCQGDRRDWRRQRRPARRILARPERTGIVPVAGEQRRDARSRDDGVGCGRQPEGDREERAVGAAAPARRRRACQGHPEQPAGRDPHRLRDPGRRRRVQAHGAQRTQPVHAAGPAQFPLPGKAVGKVPCPAATAAATTSASASTRRPVSTSASTRSRARRSWAGRSATR